MGAGVWITFDGRLHRASLEEARTRLADELDRGSNRMNVATAARALARLGRVLDWLDRKPGA